MNDLLQGSPLLTKKIAAELASAYLRLTQTAQNDAVFRSDELQKGLDVSATESPHVVEETA